ncbi:hypothetical protein [Noviherbaspirillum saxi]|uniref:hypothetical protein n=1 Tax=Noviherbaspirillum saxi TaxID=2320863 RepID=UPI0018F722BC|nr:hypothetical protein [Noviherbaspirillum saxi]
MQITKYIVSVLTAIAITGCAHPIAIGPDIAKIERDGAKAPVVKNVAYYISEDVRTKEVTTPGGGGDKVSYQPYRDMETAFYKMLTNVFGSVTKLKTAKDAEAISRNNVSYIITPEIVTNSSSPSPFTWPPTKFNVDLTCQITDALGNPVLTKSVSGEGNAEFSEFKSDFSLSGKRASQDALLKMQRVLLEAAELRK